MSNTTPDARRLGHTYRPFNPGRRHRANFAQQAEFLEFDYRYAPVDDQPGNFDATALPILAAHYFGRARKRAGRNRPPGPGEAARAYKLRKRGAHLQLIHSKISEQPSMTISNILAKLNEGEILEKDRGQYRVRADLVSKKPAERLIREGLVDVPRDLFNLTGGRITELGRDVLLSNGGLADVG